MFFKIYFKRRLLPNWIIQIPKIVKKLLLLRFHHYHGMLYVKRYSLHLFRVPCLTKMPFIVSLSFTRRNDSITY